MTETASLIIKVDSSGAAKATDNLNKLDKAAGNTERAASKLGKAWGVALGLISSAAIIGATRAYIQQADAFANMSAKLKLVTGSTEAATKAQRDLFKLSQETSSELAGTTELYVRLGQSSKELASNHAGLLKITEAVSKAMVVSGASVSEAASSVRQFTQAVASGLLRGDEFNSIMENSPRLAKALADGLEVPIGSLRKMAEEGELTASKVVRAILSQSEVIDREFGEMPLTVSRATQQVRNALTQLIGDTDKATGASADLAEAIESLARTLESEETKSGFAAMITGLTNVAGFALKAANAVMGLHQAVQDALSGTQDKSYTGLLAKRADIEGELADARKGFTVGVGASSDPIAKLLGLDAGVGGFNSAGGGGGRGGSPREQELRRQLAEIDARIAQVRRDGLVESAVDSAFAPLRNNPAVDVDLPEVPEEPKPDKSAIRKQQAALESFLRAVQELRAELGGPLKEAEIEHIQRQQELIDLAATGKIGKDALNEALALEEERYKKTTEAIQQDFAARTASLSGPLADAENEHIERIREIDELGKDASLTSEKIAELKAVEAERYREVTEAIEDQLNPARALIAEKEFELSLMGLTEVERQTAIDLRNAEGKATDEQAAAIRSLNQAMEDEAEKIGALDDHRALFEDLLVDLPKRGKDAWKDFLDDWGQMMTRMAARKLVEQVFGGYGTNGSGSGGGDFLGGLLGAFLGGGSGGGESAGSIVDLFSGSGFGFASGGYTGVGGRNQVAGIAHKGEVVWSQDDVARAGGVGAVERMRRGGGRGGSLTQNFIVNGTPDRRTREQMARESGREARRGMARTGG